MCNCQQSKEQRERLKRAYNVYLKALKQEHEHSFLQDEIDGPMSMQDLQLALDAEIEIVEDLLRNI